MEDQTRVFSIALRVVVVFMKSTHECEWIFSFSTFYQTKYYLKSSKFASLKKQ
jgi:hypothetical protein